MYQSLYTLISELIFNGSMNAVQTEVVTWLATCTSLFVVVLPVYFLAVLLRSVACGIWR